VRVPTLREVLAAFPRTWLSIDLKAGDPLTELTVVQLVRAVGAEDRVVVGAEADASAQRLRALAPELSSFFSAGEARAFYVRHRLRCFVAYRAPARSLQIPVQHGQHDLARRRLVDDAHRRGIAVRYWTVNDEPTMQRLLELGADGIITDRPALLRDLLRQRGG
jgi:glycerophosphoryl diester phosphodiesterase